MHINTMMKEKSIWQEIKTPKYQNLNEDITTDILIIGGGITGVSTFYALKDNPLKISLVEKNRLGYGVTSRSTAKITLLQQDIYSRLKKSLGLSTSKSYYQMMHDAINNIVNIVKKEKIDCDLEESNSYLYALNDQEVDKVLEEEKLLNTFGEKTYPVKRLPDGTKIKTGFYIKGCYVFHPLKYVSSLAQKALKNDHEIYENTIVLKIVPTSSGFIAYTEKNKITCQKIILANHYPYFLLPYLFPFKGYLEKSYIAVYERKNLDFNAINISNPIYSYRYYKDYLFRLTSSHNLCFKDNNAENFASLKNPDKIKYCWSNHDIMTLDHLPYIGPIKDNLFLATGFNTWGMTGSSLASIILKDLIDGRKNAYFPLVNPKRSMSLESFKNLGISIFSTSYSFLKSKVYLNKSWYHQNPYYTKINNQKVAIYTDEKGGKHIVYVKCPHLGCNLNFNMVEKTWECPCHGSVFDLDGHSIMGPSNYNISANKDIKS